MTAITNDPTIGSACYYCVHCGNWYPKDSWGPGRITCPNCKKRAPTAEQWHQMLTEEYIDGEWNCYLAWD